MVRGERRHGRARSEGMGREEQGARTGAWMGESKERGCGQGKARSDEGGTGAGEREDWGVGVCE